MYTCRYFQIEELVDPIIFDQMGEDAWGLFNPEALKALDDLRDFFGRPITVNNWKDGGAYQFSGYRPASCPVGAPRSEHRNGNAFDCKIEGLTAEEARQMILDHMDHPLLQRIQRLEADVSWVHFDLHPGVSRIYVFKA